MFKPVNVLCVFLVVFLCFGCAGLQYNYETPSVTVTSFNALPTEGIVPRFEIGLLVTNPNRTVLDLKGVSYSIEVEGYKILTGVSNKLPQVEGYGQGEVVLSAAPNLFSGIQLITELMNRSSESLQYAVDVKLDTGAMRPMIKIREEGKFSFGKNSANQPAENNFAY